MSPSSSAASSLPSSAVNRFAWFTVAYVGAVILFGAVVRVTGSGAGCGVHWPTCQGELVHLPKRLETLIELTHRVTSGITLPLVLGLYWLVRRNFVAGHPARRFAVMAVVFLIIESLIGAVLVLFGLVVGDRSMARAVMMPLHLVNASLLMATLSLTAFGMTQALPRRHRTRQPGERPVQWLLLGLLLASMLGALTALGDTLFPPGAHANAWAHIVSDQSARAHWLERLRIIHPVVSVIIALYGLRISMTTILDPGVPRLANTLAKTLLAVIGCQLLAGVINVWLDAPAVMQVIHLALALLAYDLATLLWAKAATPIQEETLQRFMIHRKVGRDGRN